MKTQNDITVRAIEQVSKMLWKDYDELLSWGAVAKQYGLTKPMIWRIANKGYEPAKPQIRLRLGLPAMKPVPACRHCGDVHVSSRCPVKPPARRRNSNGATVIIRGKAHEVIGKRRMDSRPFAPVLVIVREA